MSDERFPSSRRRLAIPLWIKVAYTAFMALMIPVYLRNYGITNFLYFCDVAAVVTLVAMWMESPLVLSAMLVGAFIPQMLWVIDFMGELTGLFGLGLTAYMFNAESPFFLRFLSFFHFWLVFLLIYLVWRVGYDRRGLVLWIAIAWVLLTVCYAWMPPPSPVKDPVTGVQLRDPNLPANINYVYGLKGEEVPQTWMEPNAYFALYMTTLMVGIYPVTHLLLRTFMPPAASGST
jgi:hypothetical protein